MRRDRIFIIAEAGINHNGDIRIAEKMVDAAATVGADAVKFQTFVAEKIVSRDAPKAEYQKKATGNNESQHEMLKRLELGRKAHKELFNRCRKRGIKFLSTAFDIGSVDFLYKLGVSLFKVPSGEITNLPYLRKIGGLKKRVLLSTGMADLGEIEDALNVLIEVGTDKEKITVLHCTTEYPAPFKDVNLTAMVSIRDAFRVTVGYSDHTTGIEIPIAAVTLGASVIEKHFTLDRNMSGPDHSASVEPAEFSAMVASIRNVEKAIGDGVKRPSPSEKKNIPVARKSIVAAHCIKKGEKFTTRNLSVKRPGTGLSPMMWDNVLGRRASRDFKPEEEIEL